MNWLSTKAVRVLVAFVAASFFFSAHAAKVKFKYRTTDAGQVNSKTTMTLEDVPGHELSQVLTVRNYNVSTPDYDVKETWVYEQLDTVAGTGSDRGPNIDVLKNGDKAFYFCEPAIKTITKEDKSWETTWEGKCRFTGGTGKLKNIKGSITFKGKATPEQAFSEEGEYDVEY
jgi:hypothetical protein